MDKASLTKLSLTMRYCEVWFIEWITVIVELLIMEENSEVAKRVLRYCKKT